MYHYPFHLRDYVTKTRHLSLMEDLAYRRLLDAYYTNEGPLPLDPNDCARLIAMREHLREVESVLSEFFTRTDEGWSNARCEEELSKYRGKADSARKANSSRWGKRSDSRSDLGSDYRSDSVSDPDLKRNADQIATKNQEPRTKTPKPPAGDFGFEEFWSAYPRKEAKPKALSYWLKLAPDDELRAKIIAHVASRSQTKDWTKEDGKYVPLPTTFINQRRWEDEIKGEESFWSEVEPWA